MHYIRNNIVWILFLLIPCGFIGETLAVILILLLYRWRGFPYAMLLSSILLFHSIILTTYNNYPYERCFQQVTLIFLYFIAYYSLYKLYRDHIESIWEQYLKVCYFFSIVAISQYVLYILLGYDVLAFARPMAADGYILRLHAYFEEPGTFSTFLSPCVAYYMLDVSKLKEHYHRFVFILVTYICSFTAIAFFILGLIALYKLLTSNYRYVTLVIILLCLFSGIHFSTSDKISSDTNLFKQSLIKISETTNAFSDMDPYSFELLNLSSYATLTNIWVAYKAPSRITGTGIGTHSVSYSKLYQSNFPSYGLNMYDAYSLLTRIFSEFGVLGLVLLVAFIVNLYNKRNAINNAVLFYIIASCIRGGHYTYNGLFFFVFLYYYTSQSGMLKELYTKSKKL